MTRRYHYPTEKIIQLFLKRPREAITALIFKFVISSRDSKSKVESLKGRVQSWV